MKCIFGTEEWIGGKSTLENQSDLSLPVSRGQNLHILSSGGTEVGNIQLSWILAAYLSG